MLKNNEEYLSEVYKKVNDRLRKAETQNKRKLNIKTITTSIASSIIVLGVSLTAYAALGGTLGGKPLLNWFGIDFSNDYSEYVVPIYDQSIEEDGANLSLVGKACDDGFITFEFDLTLNEDAKNKLGDVKKMSERENGAESLVIGFNNRSRTDIQNSSIQIDEKTYDLRSPQRYQQVMKISDYEYKIYQMYFLTDRELQGKTDFTVTLDSISIVNMNEEKDFKPRVRSYKTEDSTIEDVLKENGIEENLETILSRYPDDITVDEVREDYYSDYGSFKKDMDKTRENYLLNRDSDFYAKEYEKAREEYTKAVAKIDSEMSPERKAERKELAILLELYDRAEGLSQREITMDGGFNIDLSRNAVLKDTKVIPQDAQTVTYKKMNITVDKVTVTPIQTIITLTPTISDASSNSMTNSNHKDFIGLIGYNIYDNKGKLLANHQFESKRAVVLADGKIIEWYSDDIVNNLTFSDATMILKDYIAIKTDEDFDSIEIVPYIQNTSDSYHLLDSIIVKLK